jgi:hypothetical protein
VHSVHYCDILWPLWPLWLFYGIVDFYGPKTGFADVRASVLGLRTVPYTVTAVNLTVGVRYVPGPSLTRTRKH